MSEFLVKIAENASQKLVELGDGYTKVSCCEVVRKCLPSIKRAKSQGANWDSIAMRLTDAVQEAGNQEFSITGNTTRYYYYQLTRKKKQSRSTSKTPRKSSASTPATTPAQGTQPSAPATTAKPAPTPELVARSPAAEPKPEPEAAPVVDEPPTPNKEVPKSKRQNRSTRPKNSTFTRGYEGLNYL